MFSPAGAPDGRFWAKKGTGGFCIATRVDRERDTARSLSIAEPTSRRSRCLSAGRLDLRAA
jgi:hypothetical protein